jgi:hypothetical protein
MGGRKVCLYVEERLLLLFQLIHWYSWDLVLRNRERINFYITTDFATSDKQSADFSFIFVWAYTNNLDWFWVDGVCKKQLMDANINDLFRLSQKYHLSQWVSKSPGSRAALCHGFRTR